MQTGDCFRCGQPGHWVRECPLGTLPKDKGPHVLASFAVPDSPPAIHCPCGGGLCLVRISRTAKNPGRKFYKCPAAQDCRFFDWCDKVIDEQINFRPVSVHPVCPCGSGRCRKVTAKAGPNVGRAYYVCSIKKNFGACGFFQWEDAQIPSEPEEGRSRSPCSTLIGVSDSGAVDEKNFRREVDLTPCEENEVNQTVLRTPLISSSKLEKEHPAEESNLVYSGFEKLDPVCSVMLASGIYWQLNCRGQISAAAYSMIQGKQVVGFCVNGWLGRLVFPPFRCLKAPSLMPVLCSIFPSSAPTVAHKDVVHCETEVQVLPSLTPQEDVEPGEPSPQVPCGGQPTNGAFLECDLKERPSATTGSYAWEADEVTSLSDSTDGSEQMGENTSYPVSNGSFPKHEANPEHTLQVLQCQSGSGETGEHEANPEHTHQVLQCQSGSGDTGHSFQNGPSLLDLIEQYNTEKIHFDSVSTRHAKALTAFTGSYRQLNSLHEKANHLRTSLLETEKQLACCKAGTLEFAASFREVSGELAESQKRMQVSAEKLAKEVEICKQR